ncbi:DUF7003 family protein [Catellatospora vulcania]|uniref:DUF7003 family protein n=1 Tax=Catellatospora vulcania TaxID=1460450 RepID=UPI001E4ABB53|nr:hypothetical protein [Catellatospora vulcania]
MITSDEVLAQLDRAAKGFDFPDLENGYYYAIDARLHAFRDDARWALVVELVGYNPRAANVIDVLHCFGNCLTEGQPGYTHGDFLDRVDNMHQVEDPEDGELLRGGRPPIVVRGQAIEVEATAGEPLWDVFRRLVPEHRDLLLADDEELRHRLPDDLPRIMVLEQWWHRDPDRFDQLPSETETFQQLAQVLVTGDIGAYRPTHAPNTHWSFWPESGSL